MATDEHEEQSIRVGAGHVDDATAPASQRSYGAEMNAPHAVEGDDDVSADNDASARAAGAAGEQAGSGAAGLGGGSGGSGNYAGVGLPGGARTLGTGPAPNSDSSQSGTSNSGGLGTPANAATGSGEMRSADVPPGTHGGASDSFRQAHGSEAGAQHPSAHDHGGHLSLAGGSAGSGGGGADLLDDSASATNTSGA